MSLSEFTETREITLRSTGMSDFEHCPRYFLFRHRAGLVPKGVPPPALQRGTMFHQIIAARLSGKTPEQAEWSARTASAKAITQMTEEVGPAGYLPNGQTPEEAAKAIEANTLVAIAMSRAYSRFFSVGLNTIGGLTVIPGSVEAPVRVGGMSSQLVGGMSGQLDALAIDPPRPNEAWVVDHKTCGWDVTQYARTLPLSAQTAIYPLLGTQLLEQLFRHSFPSSARVAGICYCIIKTPTIRCCKTDGFDLNRYAARVEQWYQDNSGETMLRTFIRPSKELVAFSKPRLDKAAAACISLPWFENFPATGGSACQRFNTLCPYIGLCTRDTAGWKEELERFDRVWRDEEDENESG